MLQAARQRFTVNENDTEQRDINKQVEDIVMQQQMPENTTAAKRSQPAPIHR